MDFFNILKGFESEFSDETETRKIITNKIVSEVKKYDVYDFIAKIAGLNLMSENQNKSILIDAIVAELLCLKHGEVSRLNKMNDLKFKKTISQVNNTTLCMMVDPNENTFVQNVMFHKNYTVFNGIDQTPSYNLQNLIKVLFEIDNYFAEDFLVKIHKLFSFILGISDSIASRLNLNIENTISDEKRSLVIPTSEKVELYSNMVTINGEYFDEFFKDMNFDYFFSEFESLETGNIDCRPFYSKPFLRNKRDNSIIILNISLLPTFAFYLTIIISEEYGLKEKLISLYHSYTWRECRKYLHDMGHLKIAEDKHSIEIVNRPYYKEMIVTVYNDQLMLVIYLSDDGVEYTDKTMHGFYPNRKHNDILERRLKYYNNKFLDKKIMPENLYVMLIISGFGRGLGVNTNINLSRYSPVKFNPIELKCISILERKSSGFLPRYMRAKNKFRSFGTEMFSELDKICIYTNNNYSFYFSDEFNVSNINMYIPPGDSVHYIKEALHKEDRKRILSYEEGSYAEVIAIDKVRNIYVEEDIIKKLQNATAVCFDNLIIWVTSGEINEIEELELYYSIIDTISFWLAECKGIINSLKLSFDMFQFKVLLVGEPREYYYDIIEERKISELISTDFKSNHITMIISSGLFHKLNKKDNSAEKELCLFIIDLLNDFSFGKTDYKLDLEKIFINPLKKKIFTLDCITKPYLKPIRDNIYITIHSEDEDHLSDLIGKKILQSGKWTHGIIDSESRGVISNYIVEMLYSMLQDEVKELNPLYVVEAIYLDLEKTLYRLMLARERYAYDISCYPEKKDEILKEHNSDNKTSISLKFLMEYIAARPPEGTKILGIGDYEYLLAICSMIIDWAYKNDLFYYNIFDTPVEILKSDRIGLKHKEFADMFQYGDAYRQDKLNYTSSSEHRKEYEQVRNDYEVELNEAFFSERRYTYKQFIIVVFEIIEIGKGLNNDVCVMNKLSLISMLVSQVQGITEEQVIRIISDIIIVPRDNFLKLSSKYRKEDVYPWRFNRLYSFNRRPIIERGNDLIWGNRQLYHMVRYVTDLIYNGTYSTKDKKMATLIGKISNERGKLFNETINWILSDFKVFDIYPNLKKINRKPISDKDGNTLGDIDILFIDHEKNKIFVTEVKSFSFSRNPYEIQAEYNKMFVDTEKNKCFVTKHNRRVEWVKNHFIDTCKQFKLNSKLNWEIIGLFIVEDPVISNKLYKKNIEIVHQQELTLERIRKIKSNN